MPRFKQIKQDLEDSGLNFNPRPQKSNNGLTPLGNTGIYTSPDKPIEPNDCRFYPNSPLCGGNPFDKRPIGLDTELIWDECDKGLKATGVVGFIKLPTHEIVYRSPECREPKQPKPPPPPDEEPPPPPSPKPSVKKCRGGDFELFVREFIYQDGKKIFNRLIPYLLYLQESDALSAQSAAESNFSNVDRANEAFGIGEWKTISHWNQPLGGLSQITCELHFDKKLVVSNHTVVNYVTYSSSTIYCHKDASREILEDPNTTTYWFSSAYSSTTELIDPLFPECPPQEQKEPDPPPPKPPCMPCCCNPSNSDQNRNLERLMRLILQRIGTPTSSAPNVLTAESKILDRIGNPKKQNSTLFTLLEETEEFLGIAKMPAKFPKRLIYPNGSGEVVQKNLLDILGFQIKQLDRAIGYLPQKIKIADTNPAKSGNQSVEVEIHSIADFQRETLKYLVDMEGDQDATNNMLVRCLYELGFIHQGVVQADAMLDCISDFLDFKQTWKTVEVPFAFNPKADGNKQSGKGFDKQKNSKDNKTEEDVEDLLPKLLQNTMLKIRVLDNTEKKTLCDRLQDIKRDTAIAAAAVSEPASGNHLQKVVEATQAIIQLQSAINRRDNRQSMTSGNLKTRKNKKI